MASWWFLLHIVITVRSSNVVYTVSVNWTNIVQKNPISPTIVVAYDPLLLPESPIHDEIWKLLSDLNANHIKFIAAGPFAKVNIPQLTPPSGQYICDHINGDSYNQQFNNITLQCPSLNSVIDTVQFASYGNPIADNDNNALCGNWKEGPCHSNFSSTIKVIKTLCLNKNKCTFAVNENIFPIHCIPPIKNKQFAVQVNCTDNTPESNFNNFDFMNHIISDLMKYSINPNLTTISWTFQPIPIWFFANLTANQIYNVLHDNPYRWDPYYTGTGYGWNEMFTFKDLGNYFGRIAGWYLNNGFVDSYGIEHASPYNFSWNNQNENAYNIVWEVLNEPNHSKQYNSTPEIYTQIYDATIESIWNMFDKDHQMKFQGLALSYHANMEWYHYFLNLSNHKSNKIPIDYISFHFYAHLKNFTYNHSDYHHLFSLSDSFIQTTQQIISIKNSYSPNTIVNIDELGAGMGKLCGNNPMPDDLWWVASGGAFAYIYGKFSVLIKEELLIMAQSGLIHNDNMNSTQFPASENGINEFCGQVTMIDWNTGKGNPRYWILKLILDNFNTGDNVIKTNVSGDGVLAQAFTKNNNHNSKRILFVNKLNEYIDIVMNDTDIRQNGGKLYIVDVNTGNNPYKIQQIQSNTFTMTPFAVNIFVS
eukprot:51484_1